MMKPLVHAVVAVSMLVPALSHCQTNEPVNRAEVTAESIPLEQDARPPGTGSDPNRPENIQSGVAPAATRNAETAASDYGSTASASAQSGSHDTATEPPRWQHVYFGQ